MATGPLARPPSASDKKNTRPHQAPLASAAANKAKLIRATQTLAASDISRMQEPASTKNKPEEARIKPAKAPTGGPQNRRPKAIVIPTTAKEIKKLGSRA